MPFTRLLDLSSKVFPCEHDFLSKAACSLSKNGNGYDASNKLVRATVVSHFPAMNKSPNPLVMDTFKFFSFKGGQRGV